MSDKKQPKPGEWWQADDDSVAFIIGLKCNGDVIFENHLGKYFNGGQDWYDWTHIPDCTGWDWVPIYNCLDCGEPVNAGHEDTCQMAWVTQDRVPARSGIDERRYQFGRDNYMTFTTWEDASRIERKPTPMHGDKLSCEDGLVMLRCRRKDLPPVESPDDWVEITDQNHIVRNCDQCNAVGNGDGGWLATESSVGTRVGGQYKFLTFRCRRKDLPPVPVYPPEAFFDPATFTSDWGPYPVVPVPVPAKTKIPLRVWISNRVNDRLSAYSLWFSQRDMSADGMTEVHGLNLYIENPSASGSGDAAKEAPALG